MIRPSIFALLFFVGALVTANDIQIVNLEVANQPGRSGYATLTFDLSWANAWRSAGASANWDAAWVFAKFRTGPTEPWQHLVLTEEATPAPGATIEVLDNNGAMVYAATEMAGPAAYTGTQLVWDLYASGLRSVANVEVRVYGIEMVYVPEGAFYLGSTGTGDEVDHFYSGGMGNDRPPFRITDSGPIEIGNEAGKLYYDDVDARGSEIVGPIPADFPSGYDAFYLMKYEVSQQQYVDFFNTLSYEHKLLYDITDKSGKNTDKHDRRNCVAWDNKTGGDAYTTAPFLPIGYVSTQDMLGYFDWAALRPMTELEFEKACRGPEPPVAEEYAWGTSQITSKALIPSNLNNKEESIVLAELDNPLAGNAAYSKSTTQTSYGKGPYRCGIFAAASLLPSRIRSGAGYYGNMELSGNQWEGVVSVTHPDGLAFTNTHGDGYLSADGIADVISWPTTVDGIGIRGGRSDNKATFLRVADRSYAKVTSSTRKSRYYWLQFRGVRGR